VQEPLLYGGDHGRRVVPWCSILQERICISAPPPM
jgi:hypothetical protein